MIDLATESNTTDNMKQCASQSGSEEKPKVLQFFGKVDNQTYREFRVRVPRLANVAGDKSANGTIQIGLKRVIDQHNDRIAELENELRRHQQMKKGWTCLHRTTNERNIELIARLLDSDPEVILEFETENFANDQSWTKIRKAKNNVELKSVLSSIRELDEDGNQITETGKTSKNTPEVFENVTKTYEDTTREKIELTVKKQPDKKKNEVDEELPDILETGRNKENEGETQNEHVSNMLKNIHINNESEPNNASWEEGDEKKDDELMEKWSETTSSEPQFPITDTSCSSLGSCEFETVDEELSFAPPEAKENRPAPNNPTNKPTTNNRGKGKKGRKGIKGPKMTIEEIEAIKKKKKDEADRLYEQRQREIQAHLDKVEKTDRHRIHRRLAETALEILKKGSGILPPEIQELNEQFDMFVMKTEDEDRYKWRDQFIGTRVAEVSRTLIGPELIQKMNLLSMFDDVIERTDLLQDFLAFSATLHESSEEFTEFQMKTITLYLNGYEADNEVEQVEAGCNFDQFKQECLVHLTGPEKYNVTKEYIENRLNSLKKDTDEVTSEKKFLQETYCGINNLMEAFKQCTNVAAFLHANRRNPSFNLMEAWFLESRKPPQLIKISVPK